MTKVLNGLRERHVFEDIIGAKAQFPIGQRKWVAMSNHPRLLHFQNMTLQDIEEHEARVRAWRPNWDSMRDGASNNEHFPDIILKNYAPRSGSVSLDEDADSRHAASLLMQEAERVAAEGARESRRQQTGFLHSEDLAEGESASQKKAREVVGKISKSTMDFARDPGKSVGDAVSNTVSFFAGNIASDAVGTGEMLAEGVSTIGDAVVQAATPTRAPPRKRERLTQRRKENLEQKTSRFTPMNTITTPLEGFHNDL